jgi:hypothetical protein
MKPKLSSRWEPGHVVRRDTSTGLFEEINSPMYDNTEIKVQRALLARPPTRPGQTFSVIDTFVDALIR